MNNNYDYLGVNKIGRNIRKSPPHQPNFANPSRQPSQPQVYNINKNDFRNVVQQLTGSPSHHSQEPPPRPTQNLPNPPNMRLQKIRPSGLAPIDVHRPRMPVHPGLRGPGVPFNGNVARPARYGQPPMMTTGANIAESPISSYIRYLQNSINDPTQGHSPQARPPQYQQQRPHVYVPPLPSPRMVGPPPMSFPSPRMNRPFIPQSPTSQFVMPSPSGYMNLLSPISPYPLLSPGYQQFPPLTPSFTFSPLAQPGIMGPGQQLLPSPGMGFPSPGFFNLASPRWRN